MHANDVRVTEDYLVALSPVRGFFNRLLFFGPDNTSGKVFNWFTLLLILGVVIASMLNTVKDIHAVWGSQIDQFELWVLYGFAVEYALRIYAARNRWHYIRSFNGLVDLVTILPLFVVGGSLVLVRLLRLVRVIRVAISFPVVRALFSTLKDSVQLLMGVLGTIALISVLMGNLVFILEPQTFSNALEGAWWSLVTMSTVGYGDFVPRTGFGKMLAATLIMCGICMFAMVTAVISVKVGQMFNHSVCCAACQQDISPDYQYCPHCSSSQKSEESAVNSS